MAVKLTVGQTQAETIESLTGTGEVFVVVQAREKNDYLHIQGKGPMVNRSYGVAYDIELSEFPDQLRKYVVNMVTMFKSLAGTDAKYFRLLMREQEDGSILFQVPGYRLNINEGAEFVYSNDPVALQTFCRLAGASASEDCF